MNGTAELNCPVRRFIQPPLSIQPLERFHVVQHKARYVAQHCEEEAEIVSSSRGIFVLDPTVENYC